MTFPLSSGISRILATLGVASLALLLAGQDASAAGQKRTHAALIKVGTAKLRSGPGAKHKATALLDEGRAARVVERNGEWVKVRLASGTQGWVRRDLLDVNKKVTRDSGASHKSSSVDRSTSGRRSTQTGGRHESDEDHKGSLTHSAPRPQVAHKAPSHPAPKPAPKAVAAKPAAKHPAKPTASRTAVALAPKHDLPRATPVNEPTDERDERLVVAAPVVEDEPQIDTTDRIEQARRQSAGAPVRRETTRSDSNRSDDESAASDEPDRSSPSRSRLVDRALSFRGTPYRSGATGNGAFDCSGFVQYLYAKQGVSLPRTAAEQFHTGTAVAKSDLKQGDLVFFHDTYKAGISHVGMYIGNGQFIHASGHVRGVRVDSLSKDYYINHWSGARRYR